MRGNTIELKLENGEINKTEPLYQWDYGQKLILTGVELPVTYEVHFANSHDGDGKIMIGDSTGVDIPDEYLATGETVYVWLFLHSTADDGETEYHGYIPVIERARPTTEEPTPVQRSMIETAIALLNIAVEQCDADVEKFPKVVEGYWTVWDAEQEEWVSTGVPATGEQGPKGDPGQTGPQGPQGPKGDPGDLSSEDVATTAETQAIIDEYEG